MIDRRIIILIIMVASLVAGIVAANTINLYGTVKMTITIAPPEQECTTITLISDTSTQNAGMILGIENDPALDPLNNALYSFNTWGDSMVVLDPLTSEGLWVNPEVDADFVGSGANWISTTDINYGCEDNYMPDAWRLYKIDFSIPSGATINSADIRITADNAFTAYLNDVSNTIAGSGDVYGPAPYYGSYPPAVYQTSQYHFNNVYSSTFSPSTGSNTLYFVVRNWDNTGSGTTNPTGLLYKVTINYCETIK